jgi:hypothetical protein
MTWPAAADAQSSCASCGWPGVRPARNVLARRFACADRLSSAPGPQDPSASKRNPGEQGLPDRHRLGSQLGPHQGEPSPGREPALLPPLWAEGYRPGQPGRRQHRLPRRPPPRGHVAMSRGSRWQCESHRSTPPTGRASQPTLGHQTPTPRPTARRRTRVPSPPTHCVAPLLLSGYSQAANRHAPGPGISKYLPPWGCPSVPWHI